MYGVFLLIALHAPDFRPGATWRKEQWSSIAAHSCKTLVDLGNVVRACWGRQYSKQRRRAAGATGVWKSEYGTDNRRVGTKGHKEGVAVCRARQAASGCVLQRRQCTVLSASQAHGHCREPLDMDSIKLGRGLYYCVVHNFILGLINDEIYSVYNVCSVEVDRWTSGSEITRRMKRRDLRSVDQWTRGPGDQLWSETNE